MTSISILLRGMKDRPTFIAFIMAAALIVSLCLAFDPRWETNDDVVMSMAAHGYGLAAYGTPNLIFSNVLWGYVVRALPSINGVLGYSLATMAILLICGWATLYFLLRLGAGYLLGLLAVALLFLRPTLYPQFTVNAGLLTVAAVIGWQVHARWAGMGSLITACLLAFFGYLIRGQEFFLVLGVALPLLPWRALRERRQMQVAFLLLSVAIASAAAFDHWSYIGQEWQDFEDLNSARLPYTDYGAGEHLKQRPEILARHGYTQNDIDLVNGWFFVDPQIADSKSLNAMLTELGHLPTQEGNIQSGFVAIKTLFDLGFLPVILSALLLLVLVPQWPVAVAWLLCLTALFAMGIIGRPGVLWVYVPLVSLLLVAPLILGLARQGGRQQIAALMLLVACVGNAYLFIPPTLMTKQRMQQVQKDVHDLPAGPIVSWANSFPFVYTFPVLANNLDSRNIRFYGLDSFTHAPFSVASAEQSAGRGVVERLQTTTGIPVIASQKRIELLRIYCGERLKGRLNSIITYQTSRITVQQIRCETNQ